METFDNDGLQHTWVVKKTGGYHSYIRFMARKLDIKEETVVSKRSFPGGNPISSRFPSHAVGSLLEVHEFLLRFQEVLGLEEPLSFEELEKGLLRPWPDNFDSLWENCHDSANTVGTCGHNVSSILGTVEMNCSRCMGNNLTMVHRTLLNELISMLLDKIGLVVNMTSDAGVSKPKRGYKKDSTNWNVAKRNKLDILPINQLTLSEVVRRYILAYLLMDGKVDSLDTPFRNNTNVISLLLGDGGICSSSLTRVAGVDGDAMLLGRAVNNVFGKLKRESNTSSMGITGTKVDSSYKCGLDSDGNIPEWAKVLDPVRRLPTNVGARIRNCVREALEKNPPEWAKELLKHSIHKEVYKGNAAGPTKRAVIEVLNKVSDGLGRVLPQPDVEETRKGFALISNVVMKKCRIVLRNVAASDSNSVFYDLVGRNFLYTDYRDVGVVFGSASSRPLDLRTIDLRLLYDAYGGSHEAFLEDVRELWTGLHMTQRNRPTLVKLAKELSENFELLYKDEVATLIRRFYKYNINGKFTVEVERELGELLNSLKIPEAPWETEICYICDLDKDDDIVLLCDTEGCNAHYHTYCLNPPLSDVPKGNWYCPSCAPREQPRQIFQLVNKSWGEASQILDIATALEEKEYWELGVDKRIFLLKFLCDESLSSTPIRQNLDQSGAKLAKVMQKFKALKSREENLAYKGVKVRRSSCRTAVDVRRGEKHSFPSNVDDDFVEDLYTLSDRENHNVSFSDDHPAKQLSKLSLRKEFLGTDSHGRLYWGFPDLGTHRGIIVNESEIILSNCPENHAPFGNSGRWCLFQSDEEISSLVDYLRTNDPERRELRDSIFDWQKSMLQGSQETRKNSVESQVISSAEIKKALSPSDLYTKATALLEAKYGLRTELDTAEYMKMSSRKNMGPKWHRCECLEPILPCRYHCLNCHETFFMNIEFEQHKNSRCGLSPSVEKNKVDIGTRNFVVPQSSLKPIVGKARHVLRQLKINLMDMEGALPDGARRPSKASSEWRSAWCVFVKSADTIYEMVQATIVLETMIKTEYIKNTWWWYWSSVAVAAKTSTMSALALRIYTLDAAIHYQNLPTSIASGLKRSIKSKENKESKKKAGKKLRTVKS